MANLEDDEFEFLLVARRPPKGFDAVEAANKIAALGTKPGDTIPEPIVSGILGVSPPQPGMEYIEGRDRALKRLGRLLPVYDHLLQQHNIMALSQKGGLFVVDPKYQLLEAKSRLIRRLDSSFKVGLLRLQNIDLASLPNSHSKERTNLLAHFGAMWSAINPPRRTKRFKLKDKEPTSAPNPDKGGAQAVAATG